MTDKPMTVGELIQKLQKFQAHLPILFIHDWGLYSEISNEYYDGIESMEIDKWGDDDVLQIKLSEA